MDRKMEKDIKEMKRMYAGAAVFLSVAMIAGTLLLSHIPEGFFM